MTIESKAFDFLSALTAVVVMTYLGVWVYAIVTGKAELSAFFKDVGPTATLLIGYWARGVK